MIRKSFLRMSPGNLDTKSSYEIMALFKQLPRQGRTVILVTHEPDIAEYAERIITFADGRIINDKKNADMRGEEGADEKRQTD